ncbi:AraC family transcriptional regulator [Spirosoma sp. KNUC1025]|uniref:helix-turn-helix domain-containing protein n=1 Tax=Spirosoma sp. KNUC1025 TaxID=2894082 RepID=UPI003866438F|nr:AraC family transcriptional regulator [Spirosoma sp. KNUC1025]
MKRHIQLDPLRIYQLELQQWSQPTHSHAFYELIIIREGKGYHLINDNCFPYSSGYVFLLGPDDNHYFKILDRTKFCFISFTEPYLAELAVPSNSIWKQGKSYNWHMAMGFRGNLLADQTDQLHLNALLSILLPNNEQLIALSPSVTLSIVGALLSLIEPHISLVDKKTVQPSHYSVTIVHQLMAYISQHISEPHQLRIDQLAHIFNYSPNYLSALFKQQVGESLQQYIIQYRLKLVEKRLQLSSLTISQIAEEFGFTDICHLNKLFKRYYQITPTVYRRAAFVS